MIARIVQPVAPRTAARILAVMVAAAGVYCAVELPRDLVGGDWSWIALIVDVGIILLCLTVAYYGWFFRTTRSVRWLCGVSTLVLFSAALEAAEKAGFSLVQLPHDRLNLQSAIIHVVLEIMSATVAILFYRLTVDWLLVRLGLADDRSPSQRLWVAKMSIGFIAFLIFTAGGELDLYTRFQNHAPDVLELLIGFAPLILAVGFYKLGVYIATRRIGHLGMIKGSISPALES
jgi:hypothetical protein